MSKDTNIFAKGYVPNWIKEVFINKKVKNTVPWTYVIIDNMLLLDYVIIIIL